MTGYVIVAAVLVGAWLVLRWVRSSEPEAAVDDSGDGEGSASLRPEEVPAPLPTQYVWRARLSLDTPLRSLERHGERWTAPEPPPAQEARSFGAWEPAARGPSAAPSDEIRDAYDLPAAAYDVDRPVLLAFLRDFRRIVEAPGQADDKIVLVESLLEETPEFGPVAEALGDDFPVSWFAGRFTRIHGVGPGTARALFDAGFRTPQDLAAATDEALRQVHGVGPSLVRQIRAHLPALTEGSAPAEGATATSGGESESDPRVREERDSLRAALGEEPTEFDVTWSLLNREMKEFARSGMQAEALRTRIRMGELLEAHGRVRGALQQYLEVCFLEAARSQTTGETGVWEAAESKAHHLVRELALDADSVDEVLAAAREQGSRTLPAWADLGERWESLGLSLLQAADEHTSR